MSYHQVVTKPEKMIRRKILLKKFVCCVVISPLVIVVATLKLLSLLPKIAYTIINDLTLKVMILGDNLSFFLSEFVGLSRDQKRRDKVARSRNFIKLRAREVGFETKDR